MPITKKEQKNITESLKRNEPIFLERLGTLRPVKVRRKGKVFTRVNLRTHPDIRLLLNKHTIGSIINLKSEINKIK